MPGLAGIAMHTVTQHDGLADTALSMASRLGLGVAHNSIETAASGKAAISIDFRPAGLWGPRVASDDHGVVIGINGEIFGVEADSGNAAEDFIRGPDSRPAETLLNLYRREGTGFIARLRGFFSLAIWDGPKETLYLATDRYALRPLFYCQDDGRTLFASEVKSILSALPSLPSSDEHGIADYMLLGMPLGLRTMFKGIQLVPTGSIVTVRHGKAESSRYWNLRFGSNAPEYGNLDTIVKQFAEVFETAVGDCVDNGGTFELPLSGGLDSRCMGSVAARKTNLRSYTMGGHDSEDLRLGPLVARRIGFPNKVCLLEAQEFIDWIESSVYITDGMYSPVNAPIMAIARRLPADATVVIDGANSFDGSYKAYDLLLHHLVPGKYSPVEQAITICPQPIVDSRLNVTGTALNDDFIISGKKHIESTYREFIDSIPPDQRGNPFDTIDFLEQSNRVRRFNMMGTVMLRAFCEVRQPFFDRRLVDFVTRLPPRYRTKEKFLMGRYLESVDPYLASLTYERTGLPANAGLARQIGRYARRGVARVASHISTGFKEKPHVAIDYMHWIKNDAGLQKFIRDTLLDSRAVRRSHVAGKKIEPFINELFAGNAGNLFLTTRLLSMELWYRFFIEHATPPVFPPRAMVRADRSPTGE